MNRNLLCDFFHLNLPADMEQCVELFAIFGGYTEPIDADEPLESLIRRHILDHFESHREHLLSPLTLIFSMPLRWEIDEKDPRFVVPASEKSGGMRRLNFYAPAAI